MTTIQQLSNLARMTVASSGTGTITLGNAVQGFLTFTQSLTQAGLVVTTSGYQITYAINDTTNSEIGTGTYFSSNLTLVRTPSASTNGGAAIDMSNAAQVFITPQLSDLWPVPTTGGGTGTATKQSSDRVLITTTSGVFGTNANLTYQTSAGGGLFIGSTADGSSTTGAFRVTGGSQINGPEWHGGSGFTIANASIAITVPAGNTSALTVADSNANSLLTINSNIANATQVPVTFGVTPANSTVSIVTRARQNWYFNSVTHTWSGAGNITGTSSRANNQMVLDQTTHQITDNTGGRTITELNGLYVLGGPVIADSGGFTATVTTNYAFRVGNLTVVGAGGAVTTAYGGYIQKPTGATNNYSLLTDGAILNTETVNASSSGSGSFQTTGGIFAGLGFYGSSNGTFGNTLTVGASATITGGVTVSSNVTGLSFSGSSGASFYTGRAAPVAGSSNVGILLGSGGGFGIFFGANSPTLLADQGSIYLRNNNSSASRMYIAASSSGNWVSIAQST